LDQQLAKFVILRVSKSQNIHCCRISYSQYLHELGLPCLKGENAFSAYFVPQMRVLGKHAYCHDLYGGRGPRGRRWVVPHSKRGHQIFPNSAPSNVISTALSRDGDQLHSGSWWHSCCVPHSFWFLVCYAATQLVTPLQQRRIHMVRSNKVARKRPTESNGTPAMDPGHVNVVLR